MDCQYICLIFLFTMVYSALYSTTSCKRLEQGGLRIDIYATQGRGGGVQLRLIKIFEGKF